MNESEITNVNTIPIQRSPGISSECDDNEEEDELPAPANTSDDECCVGQYPPLSQRDSSSIDDLVIYPPQQQQQSGLLRPDQKKPEEQVDPKPRQSILQGVIDSYTEIHRKYPTPLTREINDEIEPRVTLPTYEKWRDADSGIHEMAESNELELDQQQHVSDLYNVPTPLSSTSTFCEAVYTYYEQRRCVILCVVGVCFLVFLTMLLLYFFWYNKD